MFRKSLTLAAILLLFALPALQPAKAAPFTNYFTDLLNELNTRLASLTGTLTKEQKKEKGTLTSAVKKINKNSTSLATDIKTAQALVTLLDKAFPTDQIIGNLEDTLLDSLSGEIQKAISKMEFDGLNMVAGANKDKTFTSLLLANSTMIQAEAAATRLDRVKFMNGAVTLIVKGQKLVVISAKIVNEGVACVVSGGTFKSNTSSFVLTATDFTLTASQSGNPSRTIHIHYTFLSPFNEGTTHTLVPGTGSVSVTLDGITTNYIIDNGSLTLAVLDTATNTASGSFGFGATSDDGMQTFFNVSQGFFITKLLVVQ
ncbi:MAG: hypothetical protein ACKVS6_10895 [Planctomycetota bacterium]